MMRGKSIKILNKITPLFISLVPPAWTRQLEASLMADTCQGEGSASVLIATTDFAAKHEIEYLLKAITIL
jgi:hypothetical protein